jgi:hypothetical protein
MMVKKKQNVHVESILGSGRDDDDDEGQSSSRRDFFKTTAGALFMFPWSATAEDGTADTSSSSVVTISTSTIHKLNYPVVGKCGQANVPTSVVGLVKTFGGFQDGTCAMEGFAEPQGTALGTGDKDQQRTYSIFAAKL